MRGPWYDRLMSGSALALPVAVALALPLSAIHATAQTTATVENAVPMPDAAALPPPTASDVAVPGSTVGTASGDVEDSAAPTGVPAATATVPAVTDTATAAPAVEAPPPDPLASLDAADRPIAEKVRDLLPKADRTFSTRKERQAVEAFYQNRNLAPLWYERGEVTSRAKAVIARIQASAADGLIATDYKIPELAVTSPDAQADAELRLTATLLTFARHLQAGRFPFNRMGGEIALPQQPPDTAVVLTRIADADNAGSVIDEFSPPQPQYKALKAKLAQLRGATAEEQQPQIVRIPEAGALLRPGMQDKRVPFLRQRLGVVGDMDDLRYDDELVVAVKAHQKTAGLNPDGVVGPGTVRSLNGVAAAPRRADVVDTIIANMERWRWYPRELGNAHVVLNIPHYTLRVMQDGKEIWTTRVVVGKPSTATPMLTETMKYITVNPTWNVPPSIVQNEYLPALAQDPSVLARMGLKVVNNRDGSVHIYQPPGDNNALGRIRFNFPNRFLVYQHDTPDKHLFAHDKRAYSHGCMRVQDPLRYGEVLLSIARPGEGYTQQRLRSMYGPAEHDIRFPTPIPVHITYQTAFVDDAGELQVRPDIYNIDAKTKNLIKNERGVVEPAEERTRPAATTMVNRARPKQQPQTVGFFEALFGGGNAAAAAPRPKSRVR
jgi:L,D-transpeptidase YcbB